MENDLLDFEEDLDLAGLFEENPENPNPMDTSDADPLPELGDLAPEILNGEPAGEVDPVDPEVEGVVDPPVEPEVQPPVIFRLAPDCSNVPAAGAPLPGAVVYKTYNITDPIRVSLALALARRYKRLPASILTGSVAELNRMVRSFRAKPVEPPREPAPKVQNKRQSLKKMTKRDTAAARAAEADSRLVARNRQLENQLSREKAVAHQAHLEVNRLTRELGKERAENARLNADVKRIREERDNLRLKAGVPGSSGNTQTQQFSGGKMLKADENCLSGRPLPSGKPAAAGSARTAAGPSQFKGPFGRWL